MFRTINYRCLSLLEDRAIILVSIDEQETIGNIMMGFSKTLKGLDLAEPELIEIRIKRLPKPTDVDAHIYPVK
jgi:hypothetical protein